LKDVFFVPGVLQIPEKRPGHCLKKLHQMGTALVASGNIFIFNVNLW